MWGNGMSSYGFHASPSELDEAFRAWRPERGYSGLAHEIMRVQPMFTKLGGDTAAHRIADRMCQRARKAGLIEPVANGHKGWRFVSTKQRREG